MKKSYGGSGAGGGNSCGMAAVRDVYSGNNTFEVKNRQTPSVKAVVTGTAHAEQSTTYCESSCHNDAHICFAVCADDSYNPGVQRSGLPPPTYGKQPDWAFGESEWSACCAPSHFRHRS